MQHRQFQKQSYNQQQQLECSVCGKPAIDCCYNCALLLCREHAGNLRHRDTCVKVLVTMALRNNNVSQSLTDKVHEVRIKHWIQDTVPELLTNIERAIATSRVGDPNKGLEMLKELVDLSDKLFMTDNVTSAFLKVQMAELYLSSGDATASQRMSKIVLNSIPTDDTRYIALRGYTEYIYGLSLAVNGDVSGGINALKSSYFLLSRVMLKSMPGKIYRVASSLSALLVATGNMQEATKIEKVAQQCSDSCLSCGIISMNEWMAVVANRMVVLMGNNDKSSILSVGRAAIMKYETSMKYVKSGTKHVSKSLKMAEALESCNGGILGAMGSLLVRMAIAEVSIDMSSPSDALLEVQKLIRVIKMNYNFEKGSRSNQYIQLLRCCLDRGRKLLSKVYERLSDITNSNSNLQSAYQSAMKYIKMNTLEDIQVLNSLQRSPSSYVFRPLMLTQRADSLLFADLRMYFGIPTAVAIHDLCFGISKDVLLKFDFHFQKFTEGEESRRSIRKAFHEQRTVSSQTRAKNRSTRSVSCIGVMKSDSLNDVGMTAYNPNSVGVGSAFMDLSTPLSRAGKMKSYISELNGTNSFVTRRSIVTRDGMTQSVIGDVGARATNGVMLSNMIRPSEYIQSVIQKRPGVNYNISDYSSLQPINPNNSLALSARNDYVNRQMVKEEAEMARSLKPFKAVVNTQYELVEVRKIPQIATDSIVGFRNKGSTNTTEVDVCGNQCPNGHNGTSKNKTVLSNVGSSLHMTQLNLNSKENKREQNCITDTQSQFTQISSVNPTDLFKESIEDDDDDIVARSKAALDNLRRSMKPR